VTTETRANPDTLAALERPGINLGVYVHQAAKDNTVWYNDVAFSTGTIGLVTP
jgi:hypothetical protein